MAYAFTFVHDPETDYTVTGQVCSDEEVAKARRQREAEWMQLGPERQLRLYDELRTIAAIWKGFTVALAASLSVIALVFFFAH